MPEASEFEKMKAFAQKVIAVPKKEIDARDKQWREAREKAKAGKKKAA